MNDSWRKLDAEAHEAKAEALSVAIAQLAGVAGLVKPPLAMMIEQTIIGMQHELEAHEQAAKLLAA